MLLAQIRTYDNCHHHHNHHKSTTNHHHSPLYFVKESYKPIHHCHSIYCIDHSTAAEGQFTSTNKIHKVQGMHSAFCFFVFFSGVKESIKKVKFISTITKTDSERKCVNPPALFPSHRQLTHTPSLSRLPTLAISAPKPPLHFCYHHQ